MRRNVNTVSGPQFNHLLKKCLPVLYSSANIIWVIISKRMRRGACSTYGGEERCIHDFGGET